MLVLQMVLWFCLGICGSIKGCLVFVLGFSLWADLLCACLWCCCLVWFGVGVWLLSEFDFCCWWVWVVVCCCWVWGCYVWCGGLFEFVVELVVVFSWCLAFRLRVVCWF